MKEILIVLGIIFGYLAPVISVGIYFNLGWGVVAFLFPIVLRMLELPGCVSNILLVVWAYFCLVAAFAVMQGFAWVTVILWALIVIFAIIHNS